MSRIVGGVQSGATSYVFLADAQGNVTSYKSATQQESDSDHPTVPPYTLTSISFTPSGSTNTTTPRIAPSTDSIGAVAYSLNGKNEVRLYFVDKTSGYLREICQTDGGPWTEGSASNQEETMSDKTSITACVDYTGKGYLKVYYFRPNQEDDNNKLRVFFCALGTQAWSSRDIVS